MRVGAPEEGGSVAHPTRLPIERSMNRGVEASAVGVEGSLDDANDPYGSPHRPGKDDAWAHANDVDARGMFDPDVNAPPVHLDEDLLFGVRTHETGGTGEGETQEGRSREDRERARDHVFSSNRLAGTA